MIKKQLIKNLYTTIDNLFSHVLSDHRIKGFLHY